ncbi:MAG: error-prone DNA polymerase [Acidimicrobiia bacterium]
MGFDNPPMPWGELERRLSGRPGPGHEASDHGAFEGGRRGDGRRTNVPGRANGGDSPAWSRKRQPYERPAELAVPAPPRGAVPYAELHCHSNFSFLDGASHPEELVEEAARLGLEALALTDHDGFYGVVRFAEAARVVGVPTVFGAELSLGLTGAQNGRADPEGDHLVVLARDPPGYARLARALSAAQLRGGEKGRPVYDRAELAAAAGAGHWQVLTGCRKGAVAAALVRDGPAAAGRALAEVVELAGGRHNVAVELWDHGGPLDSARNDALAEVAARAGVECVATNNVHYATPGRRRLATALAAVRARRSLDEIDGWLPAAAGAHLRSGGEQARWSRRYPGVVERAAELGRACAFDLRLVAPALPPYPCPDGLDEMGFLRRLVDEGAARRYGPSGSGTTAKAYAQLAHELDLIGTLGFPGYFLIVWDIVEFCRRSSIYCQGRGSAANSAVCYALGITNADAVALGLLFERFLSSERDGPPDIDVDIESGRREEVIQYVYQRYGRECAAQVANVITYRAKSAIRDMAKALGHSTGQQDAWSKQVDAWGPVSGTAALADHEIPAAVLALAAEVEHFPRHLGIHSGGMVICDRPVVEVCPVEWGRFTGRDGASDEPIRSVLQWDKDDCAAAGLVKFDLLGLGMLSALHRTVDLVRAQHRAVDELELATIPQEPAVYDMLCRADSVGVFQVESRAQMATLPRLKPRTFYDLVVEVALIRPGPIQGGSVHPYIRRRNGTEPVTYLHPLLEPALEKTLGVPLFQEQMMQMAIEVAGFTPGEADRLRQAMAAKRSRERMEELRQRLYDGMAERGVTGPVADEIWEKLAAFANYGFPESHSVSFAYLVYASAWFKRWYPAAFCAGLLDAQPMGFYSPHSLVQDARRHGVEVRTPDLNASGAGASLEGPAGPGPAAGGEARPGRASADGPWSGWGDGGPVVRLGLGSVRGIGDALAGRIVAERDGAGPYQSMEDLVGRVSELTQPQLEAMAVAGVFASATGPAPSAPRGRREALWAAGAVVQSRPGRLGGIVTGTVAPMLPGMSPAEEARADLWATGVSPDGHPTRFVRDHLHSLGVVPAAELADRPAGTKVLVGGVVTHRQRPATAAGITFINLEDETGLINVVCSKGCWARYRQAARSSPALLVRGRLEKVEGVINVVAEHLEPLPLPAPTRSRDFR